MEHGILGGAVVYLLFFSRLVHLLQGPGGIASQSASKPALRKALNAPCDTDPVNGRSLGSTVFRSQPWKS